MLRDGRPTLQTRILVESVSPRYALLRKYGDTRFTSIILFLALACLATGSCSGCSRLKKQQRSNYTTITSRGSDSAELPKKMNKQALLAMSEADWGEAEQLLADALAADVNYGPAHNNLGQIYLRQHRLYLAAWEFEFASRLMPTRSEPLLNLGLVYETAGQLEVAQQHFEDAFELAPNNADCVAALARIYVKLEDDPERTRMLLNEVVMHRHDQWVPWARELLETRYRLGMGMNAADLEPPAEPSFRPMFDPQDFAPTVPEPLQVPVVGDDADPNRSSHLDQLPSPPPQLPNGDEITPAPQLNLDDSGLLYLPDLPVVPASWLPPTNGAPDVR